MVGALLGLSACGLSESAFLDEQLNSCGAVGECAANLEGVEAADATTLCEAIVLVMLYDDDCTFDKKAGKACLEEIDALTCNTETGVLEGEAKSCESIYVDADGKACEPKIPDEEPA